MGKKSDDLKSKWNAIRQSPSYHNIMLFLVFVVIATGFWFITAMNEKVDGAFDIALRIVNVPDSVTFITEPPTKIHVNVQDKGTNLFRSGMSRHPQLTLNFKDFSQQGAFRVTPVDMTASLRSLFGASAQIISTSIDSISLPYTTEPGRVVPIKLQLDLEPVIGSVVSKTIKMSTKTVRLYSTSVNLDTISYVRAVPVIRRNLQETTNINVAIVPIPGVRIIPDHVKLSIPVEPLVKKQTLVEIKVLHVPSGESILLFPAKAEVEYFLPMNMFDSDPSGFVVTADYNDIVNSAPGSNRLHVNVTRWPGYCEGVTIPNDSVEYTIVKKM